MKFEEVNKLLIGGLATLSVAFVLTLVCLGIYGWAEVDTSTLDGTYSLWRVCVTVGSIETCQEISDPPTWLKAVRGLIITAVFQIAVAIIITIVFLVRTKMTGTFCSRSGTYGIIINGTLAVVIQTIANIIYGAEFEDDLGDDAELAHAFALHVVASVLVIAGALMVFFSYKKTD